MFDFLLNYVNAYDNSGRLLDWIKLNCKQRVLINEATSPWTEVLSRVHVASPDFCK